MMWPLIRASLMPSERSKAFLGDQAAAESSQKRGSPAAAEHRCSSMPCARSIVSHQLPQLSSRERRRCSIMTACIYCSRQLLCSTKATFMP